MQKKGLFLVLVGLFFLLQGCVTFQNHRIDKAIRNKVLHTIKESSLTESEQLSVCVYSVTNKKEIVAYKANQYITPASTQKLFITGLALKALGKDFRFTTEFGYVGSVQDSILYGNILIKVGGDPTINSAYYRQYSSSFFENLTDSLRIHGIKNITGTIAIDTTFSVPVQAYGDGWAWDDFPYSYSPPRSKLMHTDNCTHIKINCDSLQSAITLQVFPPSVELKYKNNMSIVAKDSLTQIKAKYNEQGNEWNLTGTVAKGAHFEKIIANLQPEKSFIDSWKDAISKQNSNTTITTTTDYPLSTGYTKLFTITSPPLDSLIVPMNKESVNQYAEMLFSCLHEKVSENKLHTLYQEAGINPDSIYFVDGCGLSRYNQLTARQLERWLLAMWQSSDRTSILTSLPIAGTDGTLIDRMKEGSIKGAFHAKTGSMRWVRNIAGYLQNKKGEWYIVVIMQDNATDSKKAYDLQEKICHNIID